MDAVQGDHEPGMANVPRARTVIDMWGSFLELLSDGIRTLLICPLPQRHDTGLPPVADLKIYAGRGWRCPRPENGVDFVNKTIIL